jgi:flagellar biosynthetic protein FlhB
MSDSFQERSEPASPKRLSEARQKGQVAQSQDINTVAILASALLVLVVHGGEMLDGLRMVARRFLSVDAPGLSISTLVPMLSSLFKDVALIVLPLAATVAVAGVSAQLLQVGPLLTTQPLTPNLSRLDMVAGFKRMFSLRSFVDLIKATIKIGSVVLVTAFTIPHLLGDLVDLARVPLNDLPGAVGGLVIGLILRMLLVLVILAAADYVFQRFDHSRTLRMSKGELKDEVKQAEGDTHTRGRIRAKQIELNRNRMLAAVSESDVVVTNPVHVAVALRYDPERMAAPHVVAKGARLIAERIKAEARRHGIPVVQNPPIARLLYRLVQVGREVPLSLYQAVAEILAFVYRTRPERYPGLAALTSNAPAQDLVTAGEAREE